MHSLDKLVNKFRHLPGVGAKTALRYAFAVIEMSEADASEFCEAITELKQNISLCKVCGNFTEGDECEICKRRDHKTICVVSFPKDVIALEKARGYKGVYHVLHGTISPLEGRGPDDIKIKELLARVGDAEEVIVATNPDVEGEATAMYIAKILKPLGVKVSRIARGISIGSDIEYADELTIARALEARTLL